MVERGTEVVATAGGPRRDVQGLRAVAVALVILYHLAPNRLPGGFVGVDVFFVISGYLIIGTLHREVLRTGRLDLPAFYARRIRRLVPAATLVLVATMLATVLLLPVSRWRGIALDVITSSLQVQNWALAAGSGDYATATESVSPLQHFWSLAVEEQFYLVVPVLLVGAVALARRGVVEGSTRAVLLVVGALGVASFVFSVLYSWSSPAQAYFVTPTRVWELALGGLLVLVQPRLLLSPAVRTVLGWTGALLVGWSALTFTTSSAFPGWIALVPTSGAALVLLAGSAPSRAGVCSVLSVRPVRWVGDISYSLYLWHWPVLVVFLVVSDRASAGWLGSLLVVTTSVGLAAWSTATVENRFRHVVALPPPRHGERTRWPGLARQRPSLRLGAALVVVSVVAATGPLLYVQQRISSLSTTGTLDADHPGALALDPLDPRPSPDGVEVVPDPAVAVNDLPVVNGDRCIEQDVVALADPGSVCRYGVAGAQQSVVLLGDSHAAQLVTPLTEAASAAGWSVLALVRNGCPFSEVPPAPSAGPSDSCVDQNRRQRDAVLESRPSLVVTSALSAAGYARDLEWSWSSPEVAAQGYRDMWRPIVEAGIPLVVVRDTPLPSVASVPECVERYGPTDDRCTASRDDALGVEPDPLVVAASSTPGVRLVDLTPLICTTAGCPAVVGNVLVYRDNHLTDTFARSLTSPLARELGIF